MNYDKTINTVTETRRVTTVHTAEIDWDGYDFWNKKHQQHMARSTEACEASIREQMEYLKVCEKFDKGKVYASTYGGWPRIWHEVIGVGMVSKWPYWEPRPCVFVSGTLGCEWYDWMHLTGAEIRG